jgi:hypothetical protein
MRTQGHVCSYSDTALTTYCFGVLFDMSVIPHILRFCTNCIDWGGCFSQYLEADYV